MTDTQKTSYFAAEVTRPVNAAYQAALERCLARLRQLLPVAGLRNPRIGAADNSWNYCDGPDWVMGFLSGNCGWRIS